MPSVKVTCPNRERYEKQTKTYDLLWYDNEKQEMKKFNATRLNYEYKLDTSLETPQYRLMPKPIVEQQNVKTFRQDKADLLKWFYDYLNYNDTNVVMENNSLTETSAVFSVDDEELDDFLYDLDRNGFIIELE
jgi:hypothetical protein